MKIPENKRRLIVTITKELWDLIAEIAEKSNRTKSQVVQDNLDYLFNEVWISENKLENKK